MVVKKHFYLERENNNSFRLYLEQKQTLKNNFFSFGMGVEKTTRTELFIWNLDMSLQTVINSLFNDFLDSKENKVTLYMGSETKFEISLEKHSFCFDYVTTTAKEVVEMIEKVLVKEDTTTPVSNNIKINGLDVPKILRDIRSNEKGSNLYRFEFNNSLNTFCCLNYQKVGDNYQILFGDKFYNVSPIAIINDYIRKNQKDNSLSSHVYLEINENWLYIPLSYGTQKILKIVNAELLKTKKFAVNVNKETKTCYVVFPGADKSYLSMIKETDVIEEINFDYFNMEYAGFIRMSALIQQKFDLGYKIIFVK